ALVSREELASGLPPLHEVEHSERGPEDAGIGRGLFKVPYGRAFYEGFVVQAQRVPVGFGKTLLPTPVRNRTRVGWTGLEFGLSAGQAPLGVMALSAGPYLAVRSTGPLRFGARIGYGVSPNAWIGNASLHRVALLATIGW